MTVCPCLQIGKEPAGFPPVGRGKKLSRKKQNGAFIYFRVGKIDRTCLDKVDKKEKELMFWTRRIVLGVLPLVALVLPACGPATGKLYGVVTYADKPVAGGMVLIIGADKDKPVRAPTDEKGNYTASGVPVGPVKIAVIPPPSPLVKPPPLPKDMDPQTIPPPPPATLNIPRKYTDPETSGLTTTVTSSAQRFDINLK